MRKLSLAVFAAMVFSTSTLSAQDGTAYPDVLLPSGNLDGFWRLTDRNADGDYLADGEAYDYWLEGVDNSIRAIVYAPPLTESLLPRFYWASTKTEVIQWGEDANADGHLDSSEAHLFFDAVAGLGGTTHEVNWLAVDNNGDIWWTNDAGDSEGLYRSRDTNADGDAMDAGETVAVLVEPATVTVSNAPITGNPTVTLGQLDSIEYDPTWGTNGRFLIEEETYDFTLALEDINGDGDFDDADEGYIFSLLWNGGTLGSDVNPDVTNLVLPIANEIRTHAVSQSFIEGVGPITSYYLLSAESSTTQDDGCVLFRGIDGNTDGDVNDAGEVTIYWDGSLDSTGATNEYNFIYGLALWQGSVYVTGEWNGAPDHERLLRLDDNNNDGDANDAGETVVLWDLPFDKTHYDPLVIDHGIIPDLAPSTTLPGFYEYYGGATCATSLPGFLNIAVGTDNFDDKPTLPSPNFQMRTWGAAPMASGCMSMGLSDQSFFGAPLPINLYAGCDILASWDIITFNFTTDVGGTAILPLPIPADGSLQGAVTYWQSAVLDPGIPELVTTSDAVKIRLGFVSYSVGL